MASFLSMKMDARHWRIMDAIVNAPNGMATQAQIQKHFGEAAMMEPLEQLYDNGWIENTLIPVSGSKPPQRRTHEFRMSAMGQQYYDRGRKAAPVESDEPIKEPPADDSPQRGRPQGSKHRPKADETALT